MRWRRRFALVVLSAVLAGCSRSADTHRYQLTGTVAGFEPSPARVDRWTLATGTPAQIEEMARFFGVTARAEGGLVTHTLSTAVIGHDVSATGSTSRRCRVPDLENGATEETKKTKLFFFSVAFVISVAPFLRSGTSVTFRDVLPVPRRSADYLPLEVTDDACFRNLSAQGMKYFQFGPSVWPPSCCRHASWPSSNPTFTAGIFSFM